MFFFLAILLAFSICSQNYIEAVCFVIAIQVFEDAYKSQFGIIILDDIER